MSGLTFAVVAAVVIGLALFLAVVGMKHEYDLRHLRRRNKGGR